MLARREPPAERDGGRQGRKGRKGREGALPPLPPPRAAPGRKGEWPAQGGARSRAAAREGAHAGAAPEPERERAERARARVPLPPHVTAPGPAPRALKGEAQGAGGALWGGVSERAVFLSLPDCPEWSLSPSLPFHSARSPQPGYPEIGSSQPLPLRSAPLSSSPQPAFPHFGSPQPARLIPAPLSPDLLITPHLCSAALSPQKVIHGTTRGERKSQDHGTGLIVILNIYPKRRHLLMKGQVIPSASSAGSAGKCICKLVTATVLLRACP